MSLERFIREMVLERFNYNNNKSFVPTTDVSANAKKALQAVSANDLTPDAGNDGSGKRKARELSNRSPQSHDSLKRMKAFFEKYKVAVDKERANGKDANSSGLIQMWNLHGGDEGQSWVNSQLDSLNQQNKNTKQRLQQAGGAGEGKGMGVFDNPMDNSETRTHSAWSKAKNREQNS